MSPPPSICLFLFLVHVSHLKTWYLLQFAHRMIWMWNRISISMCTAHISWTHGGKTMHNNINISNNNSGERKKNSQLKMRRLHAVLESHCNNKTNEWTNTHIRNARNKISEVIWKFIFWLWPDVSSICWLACSFARSFVRFLACASSTDIYMPLRVQAHQERA